MLAARAHENESELRLEEIDRPSPGPNDVIIKVETAGLAAGVLAIWQRGGYPILPRTVGNEAAGTIAELGAAVSDFAVGDRVRLHPNLCCRRCDYCLSGREQLCPAHSIIGQGIFGPKALPMHERYLNGGLAQYMLAPAWLVDSLPDSISFDAAAKVHEVADALAAWKSAETGPGATVVLTAATGAIGSAFVRLAPLLGIARVIAVGRSAERLEQVRSLAPDLVETVAFEALREDWGETGGLTERLRELAPDGVDVVLDFLPEGPGSWQAIGALKMGGSGVFMGANPVMPPMPTVAIMINCWRLAGARNCTRQDAHEVMRWMDMGALDIEDLVTHRFALSEIEAASEAVLKRREKTWMLVIHP